MATLGIWETARSSTGYPVLRLDDFTVYQAVSFTGTAGQSAAFSQNTTFITIKPDANCAIKIGANPTAITDDYPLTAGELVDIEVRRGDKISAVAT